MNLKKIITTLNLCLAFSAHAQVFFDYSFFRSQSIPVTAGGHPLSMPWAGGMNSIRFSEIDIDGDGVLDLFGFEKHGNRVLTFIRQGNHYHFAPEYVSIFPNLHDWALLKDYNNDGKPDLFTYGLAGISVYENISTDTLRFRLVTEQLQAFYYNGYVNIYASPDDYLIIDDIDNDGHLDILNFWVLGKYVHHLRNYSDDPNTFDFRLECECWGHFEEAADNNRITLNSNCDNRYSTEETIRHAGSTMLLYDFDHNGLPDLLLGDIDSPHLILLHNHGTLTDARMTLQDTLFPTNTPVTLFSMPAPSMVNLPEQNAPSIIASPADPSLTKSQDNNSVWRYDYDPILQQYILTNTAFLQEEMIDEGSGCYPVLFDWNQDGLLDLFVSNYGRFDSTIHHNGWITSCFSSSISYFQNVGTITTPVFQLVDEDFGRLRALNLQALYPTFGDFNGDGLVEMLCGQKDGTLLLVSNERIVNGSGSVINTYQNIDAGEYSTPTFFDLDNDGQSDLIIGNRRGLLSYYKNVSSEGTPLFELITDSLGHVDTRNFSQSYFGYSTPCFYRDDENGTSLICGSENGNILYFSHIENLTPTEYYECEYLMECVDSLLESSDIRRIWDGKRTGAALADLNGDHYPDLLVGNYAGGLALYKGRTPSINSTHLREEELTDCQLHPNPTTGVVHCTLNNNEHSIEHIEIFNLHGQSLLHTTNNRIDLSNLPDGMYIFLINHTIRKKVIKQ